MVINDSKKFIFIHVYKNGGCSIEDALGGQTKLPGIARSMHVSLARFPDEPNRKDYFSFAFVRNPWDRAVSSFMYVNKRARGKNIIRNIDTFRANVNTRIPSHKQHSQYNMVHDCSFIGRFEHMQKDFNQICNIIGIPKRTLPHINASKHEHYMKFYSDTTKEQVYELAKGDIDHFGFTFEGTATKNVGDVR